WANHALALGMDKHTPLRDQFFEFVRRYRMFPGQVERVNSAPWQEVVVDKDINLFELLPLFRLNCGDGGFFIDKPCVISRDPDDWNNEDVENVGVYRMQVKDRNHLGIQTVPQHDIALQLAHAEARSEDLPVAIALGNEPIIILMAATPRGKWCRRRTREIRSPISSLAFPHTARFRACPSCNIEELSPICLHKTPGD
ncbi:MAG: UbiD family decarboxylase, partial [Acidobacteriaceae bacterium]|nr:UbiD family decarboxylase [Acidobacteriaceae bacterium]